MLIILTMLFSSASPTSAQPAKGGETAVSQSARARAAYERGAFREAIDLYERAYALEQSPTLLFNLGRCYEALATEADLRVAVEKYEGYLRAAPDAPDREAVKRRIETLRAQIRVLETGRTTLPTPPPPPPAEEPPSDRSPPSPWPWVLAGSGGAALTAGIVLGAIALDVRNDAQASSSGEEAMDLEDAATEFSTGATVGFVIGGAMTLAGVTWGVFDLVRASRGNASRARLHVGATGARLRVEF